MVASSEDSKAFSGSPTTLSADAVTMDLTMCGLLPDRAAEIAQLYQDHGTWNQVKQAWFHERRGNRSTRGSSQKIFRVLSGRFKNAPPTLPTPSDLPQLLAACSTPQSTAQVLYFYLIADDPLVRYVVQTYVGRQAATPSRELDFSTDALTSILSQIVYDDGTEFDYAQSTTKRWCRGFRSVLRDIRALGESATATGTPPTIDTVPLLVAVGYSYEVGDDHWVESPRGLQYLFQPESRWEELYDRVARTDVWEYIELHGQLQLRPVEKLYSSITTEVVS